MEPLVLKKIEMAWSKKNSKSTKDLKIEENKQQRRRERRTVHHHGEQDCFRRRRPCCSRHELNATYSQELQREPLDSKDCEGLGLIAWTTLRKALGWREAEGSCQLPE